MRLAHLKKIRVVVSLVVLLFVGFVFVDWGNIIPAVFRSLFVSLQLGPAIAKLFVAVDYWSITILLVLLLTLLFGRVYCSLLCPLGTIQDLVIRWARRNRHRRWFRYRRAPYTFHYTALMVTLLLVAAGSMILVNLLEPFSITGRIIGGLARPLLMALNNVGAFLLSSLDVYILSATPSPPLGIGLLAVPVVFLTAIVSLSYFRGRYFCNSLCPVGAVLGLVSRGAVYRIAIDESTCNDCGLCEKVCKAHCIDSRSKTIDFSACVSCFNCLEACPTVGLKYEGVYRGNRKSPSRPIDAGRRKFLRSASLPVGGLLAVIGFRDGSDTTKTAKGMAIVPKPVTPPGSFATVQFSNLCTACHLCVSACPTQVLQPSLLEYGWTGVFQPRMDYAVSYCNYECVVCGEVCPSGAIQKLSRDQKKLTQIGKSRFVKEDCIVITKKKDCAACAEHCPTKAVRMVPYENLALPEVNNDLCVGCGACEHACPVEPRRAILVEANEIHQWAKKPPSQKLDLAPADEGFPF